MSRDNFKAGHRVGVALRWVLLIVAALVLLFHFGAAQAGELYTAAKLRTDECVRLQLKDKHAGRAVGQRVTFEADGRALEGVIKAFRCANGYSGPDGALIERTDPQEPWVYVRALESVK